MVGEAFASLMATAAQSESETARKLARLRAEQQSESVRRKETELAEKEREKHERWDKVLENHEKQVKAATQPPKRATPVVPAPAKPKILQPQRSMTFRKLMKEAAKVDSSTFKLGPKVKSQPRVPEKPPLEKSPKPATSLAKPEAKASHPLRSPITKPASPRPTKLVGERAMSMTPRNGSPSKPLIKTPVKKQLTSIPPPKVMHKSGGMDIKSRLKESFVPNELIPLAQGPKRDLRTIEEIQNDLWRRKGKNYPSVTGKPKEPTRKSVSQTVSKPEPVVTKKTVAPTKGKRPREKEPSDEDSFIASSNEEEVEVPEKFDYRAEIRAMFGRKGSSAKITYSDDDSDMEATGFEMAKEEERAARLARMEDEDEERKEQERVQEKKRRKLEASKGRSVK